MQVYDINRLRKAKKVLEDLKRVSLVLELTIKGLEFFNKYVIVMQMLSNIKTNKSLIDLQIKRCEKILKERGKILEG